MMPSFEQILNSQEKRISARRSQIQQNKLSYSCSSKEVQGQMTIEFVVMFPIMLMIALIACNSILFLCECSSFDRAFRESVCVYAPSPASDETPERICAHISSALVAFEERSYLSYSVESSDQSDGLSTYTAILKFTPTIFGSYPLRRVFDIDLPPIEHTVQLRVDTYKPGVFL